MKRACTMFSIFCCMHAAAQHRFRWSPSSQLDVALAKRLDYQVESKESLDLFCATDKCLVVVSFLMFLCGEGRIGQEA